MDDAVVAVDDLSDDEVNDMLLAMLQSELTEPEA